MARQDPKPLARLLLSRSLVAGFRVKRFQDGMANAVASNKVNHQKHEQGAANHHGHGDLQADLQVVLVGDSTHHVRAQSAQQLRGEQDRKSTRLNSSHGYISYAVFCLKKKKKQKTTIKHYNTLYIYVRLNITWI